MATHLDITAANGVPFRVVFLADGQSINFPAASSRRMLVEFYDRRYNKETPDGQFISRYYLSTLLDDSRGGLCLDGGFPDEWTVDSLSMDRVRAWLADH